eukprot:950239-Amphidinium_carterae.1
MWNRSTHSHDEAAGARDAATISTKHEVSASLGWVPPVHTFLSLYHKSWKQCQGRGRGYFTPEKGMEYELVM